MQETGINRIQRLFQRYLSNPARDWSHEAPFVITSSDPDIEVNTSYDEMGESRVPMQVIVDVESVFHNGLNVRMLSGVSSVPRTTNTYRLYLRATITVEDEPSSERRLKNVTDDMVRFLSDGTMLGFPERKAGLVSNVLDPKSLPEIKFRYGSRDVVEGYPDGAVFPYHTYVTESVDGEALGDFAQLDNMDNTLTDVYGYCLRDVHNYDKFGVPSPIRNPNPVENPNFINGYLALRGTENGVDIRYFLLPLDSSYQYVVYPYETSLLDDLTYKLDKNDRTLGYRADARDKAENTDEDYDPDSARDVTNLEDIKPSNISFNVVNTFFTFIDDDDVGREIRDETLVEVIETV